MQLNATNTIDATKKSVPNLLVIPQVFVEPKEGWVQWSTRTVGMSSVGEDTVSGRLIASTAPAWYYGRLLPYILNGQYEHVVQEALDKEDEEARLDEAIVLVIGQFSSEHLTIATKARQEFELGRPLYTGTLNGIERYLHTPTAMTFVGNHQYVVGQNGQTLKFKAADHTAALDKVRQIYFSTRDREIETARQTMTDFAKSAPPLILNILSEQLRRDKVLLDNEGTMLAWENGAHGMYAVQGVEWCYLLECSAARAAQFATLSQQQATKGGQQVSLQIDVSNQVPELLNLKGWRRTPEGIDWQGGGWRPLQGKTDIGVVLIDKKPQFVVETRPVADNSKFNWVGRVYSLKREVKIESPSPVSWNLTQDDVLAWGVWAGLKRKMD